MNRITTLILIFLLIGGCKDNKEDSPAPVFFYLQASGMTSMSSLGIVHSNGEVTNSRVLSYLYFSDGRSYSMAELSELINADKQRVTSITIEELDDLVQIAITEAGKDLTFITDEAQGCTDIGAYSYGYFEYNSADDSYYPVIFMKTGGQPTLAIDSEDATDLINRLIDFALYANVAFPHVCGGVWSRYR